MAGDHTSILRLDLSDKWRAESLHDLEPFNNGESVLRKMMKVYFSLNE